MPPLSEQISQSVSLLPEIYQRQVLDFIEFLQVKYRNTKSAEPETNELSFFDVAQDSIGAGEGPGDLSTNPEYMQGYGR